MNIIVLQHIKIEDPGYIKDLMLADGVKLTTIELDEGEKIPSNLNQFDGMFCMGGPMGEILLVEKKANMKFYVLTPNYREKSQQRLEQNTNKTYHDLKLKIKKLNIDFSHKDVDEKILLGTMILKNLLQTDNGFTILDSIKNPKKTLYRDEHLEIQQLISQLFKIIKNDVDYELIFPTIVSYHQVNVPHYVSEI